MPPGVSHRQPLTSFWPQLRLSPMPVAKRNTGFKTSTRARERRLTPLRAGASKAQIARDESTPRKTRRRRPGLSAVELANKVRRLPWPWALTAAQERRVVRLVARVELPTLRSSRLRVSQQRLLLVFGMASELVALLNDAYWGPRIRWVYGRVGWWGVADYLEGKNTEAMMRGDRSGAFVLAEPPADALSLSVRFARWRWEIARCPGNGGHWYVRWSRGRRPGGCPLHARALRQARWRRSPTQRVALKNVPAGRTTRPSGGDRHGAGPEKADAHPSRTRVRTGFQPPG